MARRFLVIAAIVGLGLSTSAQGPSTATVNAFNGTSLAGWHAHGAAQWRAAGGELVASAAAGPGVLMFDKSYQDLILNFSFQCSNCDAGLIVRHAAAQDTPGTMTELYAGLSGADALTLYRVSLDAQGKELGRTQLYKWTARQNPPGMALTIREGAGGWKHVFARVRGPVTAPPAGATTSNPAAPGDAPKFPTFGAPALRITRGEARFKDVKITDLLHVVAGVAPERTAPGFRKIQLTDRFYAEGISAGDVNRDGRVDILTGPYAYLAPDYKLAVEIYPPQTYAIAAGVNQAGQYTDNFLNYAHDFNGDGFADYLKINFNGAYLYMNPKGESRHWDVFEVAGQGISSETTQFGDIDGDGKPELLLSVASGANRQIGYLEPGADPTQKWTFVPVSDKGDWGGHAYGFGDINGDGKNDIVQGSGWWEQPAAGPTSGLWRFHGEQKFRRAADPFLAGSDVHVYDFNGDRLPDVLTSQFAHGPGLTWYEQVRTGSGPISWKMHTIMDLPTASTAERASWEITDKSVVFTELHAIQLVDMDGDGLKDIVTGKRWFSHGIEYPENDRDDPGVLYVLKTIRRPGGQMAFEPRLINNYVALGTQLAVTDVNGDNRPDVLTAARKGAYVFLNLPPAGAGAAPKK
jgi:hypothetical protein